MNFMSDLHKVILGTDIAFTGCDSVFDEIENASIVDISPKLLDSLCNKAKTWT